MEIVKIKNLTFKYPAASCPALSGINLTIKAGEFITIFGKSGCGKSTLLRHLKPTVTPYGKREGEIFFEGRAISECDFRSQSEKIGFVSQNPENQIVCDKVWHELAFGLESLGEDTNIIRAKVAEIASFFGIEQWFYKNTDELSGGQKQLLNLAAIMALNPSLLILDEPTSQLDPIAAREFMDMLKRINRELGVTVILSEHRLEEAFPASDKVVAMDKGKIIAVGTPDEIGGILKREGNKLILSLPSAVRIYLGAPDDKPCPVTVREARAWLKRVLGEKKPLLEPTERKENPRKEATLRLKDVWFRYEKKEPDILKGLSLEAYSGEFLAILGGNGTGKTTALKAACGIIRPYRGSVRVKRSALLPQNPDNLFLKGTLRSDFEETLSDALACENKKANKIKEIAELCRISELLERNPYDISGGELQRAALAKILLISPEIIFLDEPTKGFDAEFKVSFAEIIHKLKEKGKTIIMVSHDIEFAAKYADRCALFFDGQIVSEDSPRRFFADKKFYTTAASRISRGLLPRAILVEDILQAIK